MELSEAFLTLGKNSVNELVAHVSMGALRSYKLYDRFKIRAHLGKLNSEHLRHARPRLWERLEQNDQELARDLAQAILVSNIAFVVDVLNFLKIPHDGAGFFEQGAKAGSYLTDGWQQRVMEEFKGRYPEPLIKLYINHLLWETDKQAEVFAG